MNKYDSKDVLEAYELAKNVREKAYAPYSKYRVGVCLKHTKTKKYFTGVNIENASFGATLCAERSAFASAISNLDQGPFEFIVVVTSEENTPPCGLCLQTMAEFCSDDFPIYLGNTKGIQDKKLLKEFLPYSFRNFSCDQ